LPALTVGSLGEETLSSPSPEQVESAELETGELGLVVPLLRRMSQHFHQPPAHARNLLLKGQWTYSVTDQASEFTQYIIDHAEQVAFRCIPQPEGRPPALVMHWIDTPSHGSSTSSEKNLMRQLAMVVTGLVTEGEHTLTLEYFIARAHPTRFLREQSKDGRAHGARKKTSSDGVAGLSRVNAMEDTEDLTKKATLRLQLIVQSLHNYFVGGLVWDRLVRYPTLTITLTEKEHLMRAAHVEDVSDLDPSLTRLHSLQVPMEALLTSLHRVYPSRIRTLPAEEGKSELVILREKLMLHLVYDKRKGSFSIYSCLRKPYDSLEGTELQRQATQQCAQLISHLSYFLWSYLLRDTL